MQACITNLFAIAKRGEPKMNRLVLSFFDGERLIYKYYPEGKEFFGEIEFLFNVREATVSRKAENDETGSYGRKATIKVENIIEGKKELPRDFIQAWG